MDEVVLVREKPRSDSKYHIRVSLHDKVQACQNDDAIGPQVLARDAFFDEIRAFRFGEAVGEVGTDSVSSGCIDQIPVVDPVGVCHVELGDLFDGESLPLREFHEYENSREPFFMVLAREQSLDGFKGSTGLFISLSIIPLPDPPPEGEGDMIFFLFLEERGKVLLDHLTRIRDFYPEKTISFAVLS